MSCRLFNIDASLAALSAAYSEQKFRKCTGRFWAAILTFIELSV